MNKIRIYIASLLTLACISCDKWLDVNTDPNYPSEIPTKMPLTTGMGCASTVIGGQYAILGALWGQHFTQDNTANQYNDLDAYNVTSSTMNEEYRKIYAGALHDFKKTLQRAEADEDWNVYLIATVMDAYVYQVLADLYGKIPYFEACRADEGLIKPKFDNAPDIYTDLLSRIDTALSKDFSAETNSNPKGNDLMFNGNMQHWKEFANTLKLKIAIRQFHTKTEESTRIINNMLDNGAVFLSSDASITGYKDEPGKFNPLYDTETKGLGNANLSASQTTLNYLQSHVDPRLEYMYKKGNKGTYEGLPQGTAKNASADKYPVGFLSKGIISPSDPVVFISAAESNFLQAEALLNCKNGNGTKEKYEEGVRKAFARFGIEEKAEKMIARGGVYEYDTEHAEEQIITQKWLSMFLTQGLEAFFEFNRTGYPTAFTPSVSSVLVDKKAFVRRLVFPEYELTSNKSNVPAYIEPDVNMWWSR